MCINRDTDNPPRHCALIGILACHIGRMRAAIAFGHAKPLGGPDGDIGPHGAGLFQQRQRHRIGRDNAQGTCLMQRGHMVGKVAHMAVGARVLEQRPEDSARVHFVRVADDHLDIQRGCAGLDHGDVLGVAIAVDKERLGLRFRQTQRHGHRLGTGRRLVQQGRIGDLKPGQIADHGLEVQQCLKTPLADLGLVGGVGRVPCGVFKNIALDRRRRHRAVIALPDQRGEHLVLARHHPHVFQHFAL